MKSRVEISQISNVDINKLISEEENQNYYNFLNLQCSWQGERIYASIASFQMSLNSDFTQQIVLRVSNVKPVPNDNNSFVVAGTIKYIKDKIAGEATSQWEGIFDSRKGTLVYVFLQFCLRFSFGSQQN